MNTYAYGFPRLGKNREFKKTIESFWKNESTESETIGILDSLQDNMISVYEKSIDKYPFAEITGYDQMYDTAIMLGVYKPKNLHDYYKPCRGENALTMTKWFNTNYHYLVPDLSDFSPDDFTLNLDRVRKYSKKYPDKIPFLIGPFTFLKLSRGINNIDKHIKHLAKLYKTILSEFKEVHLEEPAFVLELDQSEISSIKSAYTTMGESKCTINLITYYDSVDFLPDLYDLPIHAIGLDFVNGLDNLENIKKHGFPKDKTLIAGLINGRNVWKCDIKKSLNLLNELSKYTDSLSVSNGAPLYHLPISLEGEFFEGNLMGRLSFAEEKISEIAQIAEIFESKQIPETQPILVKENKLVTEKIKTLTSDNFQKKMSTEDRRQLQDRILGLPLFPTTTIGSYPQTQEVRKKRAEFRANKITKEEYDSFIKTKITDLINFQESIGIDVLVHGEFERTDMVEFFAEKLDGIATTKNGWIISYGTRGYRPPIIHEDVSRSIQMTIKEIAFAQSVTDKPVKGMLTGPITIIAWSFVRDDIPTKDVAYQIALALREEIQDYEKNGIKIVQVDEPAIREKAPIKKRDWDDYFDWAIKSFRLATNTDPKTQIHTHMCYSDFGEIVDKIYDMDFDVISIETARSKGDIIEAFEEINFNRQIGLGVWDIHSPAVPSDKDMESVVNRALRVIPKENFWINPDCGLKTRGWVESTASLKNMMAMTMNLRKNLAK